MAKSHFLETVFILLALGLVGCVGAFAPGQFASNDYTNLVVVKNKIFQQFYQAGCRSNDFRMFFGPQMKLSAQQAETTLFAQEGFRPEFIDNYFLGRAVDTDLTLALIFYEDPRQAEGQKVLGQQWVGFYCATDRLGQKQEISNFRLTSPQMLKLWATRNKNYVFELPQVAIDYRVQKSNAPVIPAKKRNLRIDPLYGHLDRYGLHWAKEQAMASDREIKLAFQVYPSRPDRQTASSSED